MYETSFCAVIVSSLVHFFCSECSLQTVVDCNFVLIVVRKLLAYSCLYYIIGIICLLAGDLKSAVCEPQAPDISNLPHPLSKCLFTQWFIDPKTDFPLVKCPSVAIASM